MYIGVFTPPAPLPRGAWKLTARPAHLQGLGQPREGGGIPPPLQPPKLLHTLPGYTVAAAAPVVFCVQKTKFLLYIFTGLGGGMI